MNLLKPVFLNMKKATEYSFVQTMISRSTIMLSTFWVNFYASYANKIHAYKNC